MKKDIWKERLQTIFPSERIKTRYIDLIAYASDASFYHLIPKAIVQPVSVEEVAKLFAFTHQHQVPLTFRAAGTSLSGQAVTNGILADLSQYWRKVEAEDQGKTVRFQPGITGAMVNARLKKFSVKIGPDPASINAAMMGGILANNSSGMCCGVSKNAYHTLKYLTFVLPDGNSFNTEKVEDYERFTRSCKNISDKLLELRSSILANQQLLEKIKGKYRMKNTVGYSLNAFLDYQHPLDIFAHLMIGSEGTLGFIAEGVLNTVPDYPFKATTMLYFNSIHEACSAIGPLKDSGAEALELMDRAALRSIEHLPEVPDAVVSLPEGAAALLCEYQAESAGEMEKFVHKGSEIFKSLPLLHAPSFTKDVYAQAMLWKMRKGMFPSVGAVRKQGTTVILEDIAFPIEHLADGVVEIQSMLLKHGYQNGIIFGHAKDGNIHFVISQSFTGQSAIDQYARLMEDVVDLVVKKYNGTLKGEHGTGRNMAPFVETEWGPEAYLIMKQVKEIVDPSNLLNPGVIISEDPKAHLKNLKSLPVVESEVDKCIECGYCEHKCPSRDLTTTPRQRIVIRREMERLRTSGNATLLQELKHNYQYDGMDTCAVDGLCSTECPVSINTGELIKRLRKENHSPLANKIAGVFARNFSVLEAITSGLLKTGVLINKLFGYASMFHLTSKFKKVIPPFPVWPKFLTGPAAIPANISGNPDVIYFPACITRLMGNGKDGKQDLPATFMSLANKAGLKVHVFGKGNCCGQAFSSKGFQSAAADMMNRTVKKLWDLSGKGVIPIVSDVSSCTLTLQESSAFLTKENRDKLEKMKVLDSLEFCADFILPKVQVVIPKKSIALHPVCSMPKMKLQPVLEKIASKAALKYTIPNRAGCCGMAGDRGFFFPELTAAACREEANEIRQQGYDGYYSTGRSCEISISSATDQGYESILYLVDEVTSPNTQP